ncbi:MAG: DUF6531 domain-containing protein, partial [Verrucomicrobiota bacterium]
MNRIYAIAWGLLACLCSLSNSSGQLNVHPESRTGRFVRAPENSPDFQSFLIPLNGQKGIRLPDTNDVAAIDSLFPPGGPYSRLLYFFNPDFVFHYEESTSDWTKEVQFPIAVFGADYGGTPLYTGQSYSWVVGTGQVLNTEEPEFAIWLEIAAFDKATGSFQGLIRIQLPRLANAADDAQWTSFANNSFVWPTPEFPNDVFGTPINEFFGLTTKIRMVPFGVGESLSFNTNQTDYIVEHQASNDDFIYFASVTGFGALNPDDLSSTIPLAATDDPGNPGNFVSTLQPAYQLSFDERPNWVSTRVHAPRFNAERLPPSYAGKTVRELIDGAATIDQAINIDPTTVDQDDLDNSPELRRHPKLDAFVADMDGDPVALVNYVINEIELIDYLSYNDQGDIFEDSVNLGGVNRGALATFLERQGSPVEQCALLVYLLRQAGVPATYVYPEHNQLKMLDQRLSSVLGFQVEGFVNHRDETEGTQAPVGDPTLIPVNYPWVALHVDDPENPGQKKWVHVFPWIKDTEVVEGADLYSLLPEAYNSAQKWIEAYFKNDPAIVDSEEVAFQQDENGNDPIVIEAEFFSFKKNQGTDEWRRSEDAGASGIGSVVALPDGNSLPVDINYTTLAPQLDYKINFTQAGTYYVWVRGKYEDIGSDSVHIGLNGQAVSTAERLSNEDGPTLGWTWGNERSGNDVRRTIVIPSPGIYTLNAWMREDGFVMDKILLTQDAGFTPSGVGPLGSPQNIPPDDTPATLFPKFVEKQLEANHPWLSLEDIGIQKFNRRNYVTEWEDFPRPFELSGTPAVYRNLLEKDPTEQIFDTVTVSVTSNNNPAKTLSTTSMKVLDTHNRKFLFRFEKTGSNQHNLIMSMAPFRESAVGTGDFGNVDPDLLPRQELTLALDGTDGDLSVDVTYSKHRAFDRQSLIENNPAYEDRWDLLWGFFALTEYNQSIPLEKGEHAALAMNFGRVTPEMLDVHAQEFWELEETLAGNPAHQPDPEVYQGTNLYLMGATYFHKLSGFDDFNARLHKTLNLSRFGVGLFKLVPDRVNGQLPNNGDLNYVSSAVDIFTLERATIGNNSTRPDHGNELFDTRKNEFTLLTAAASAYEHDVLKTYFGLGDSVSTVRLLQRAAADSASYPDGIYELNSRNYTSFQSAIQSVDPAIWQEINTAFTRGGGLNDFTVAYVTSEPIKAAKGSYEGMGAFIVAPGQTKALISNNLNGGFSDFFASAEIWQVGSVIFYRLQVEVTTVRFFTPVARATPVYFPQTTYSLDVFNNTFNQPPALNPLINQQTFANTYGDIINNRQIVGAFANDVWIRQADNGLDLNFPPSNPTPAQQADAIQDIANSGWFGGAINFSDVQNFVADPVNTVTGEFYINDVDLSLPGPMPLEIRRNYTSQSVADGPLGWGWKLSFVPWLVLNSDSSLIYAAENDGSIIAYRKQSGVDEWIPEVADNPNLANRNHIAAVVSRNPYLNKIVRTTEASNTIYTLTTPRGDSRRFTVRSFPTTGVNGLTRERPYLERWTDHAGNFLDFEFYETASEPEYGQLKKITSSNGNFVGFYYDRFGHIVQAFTRDGRRVFYQYDDFGDLRRVIRPDDSEVLYDYRQSVELNAVTDQQETISEHLLLTKTMPDGRLLRNVYDGQRRVIEQWNTSGENLNPVLSAEYAYSWTDPNPDGTITGTTTLTSHFDGTTSHAGTYQYQNSNLTQITDPLSQAVEIEWFPNTDDGSLGWYPRSVKRMSDKRQSARAYTAETRFFYDAAGNLDYKEEQGELDGDPATTNEVTTTDYSHTTLGTHSVANLLTGVEDAVGNRMVLLFEDTAYPYQPTSIERRTPSGLVSVTRQVFTEQVDTESAAYGLLQEQTRAFGQADAATTTFTHNSEGFITSRTEQTGTSDPAVTLNFSPNLRGEIAEVTDLAGRSTKFAYDGVGRLLWTEKYDTGDALVGWRYDYFNRNGELEWSDGPRYSDGTTGAEDYVWNQFDGMGRLTEQILWRSRAKDDLTGTDNGFSDVRFATTFHRYDRFGNRIQSQQTNGNSIYNTVVRTFDGIGQLQTRTVRDGEGTAPILSTESFQYEPGGQLSTYTDPLNGDTQRFYTDRGQLREQRNPDGTILKWEYYLDGRLRRIPVTHNTYWSVVYDDDARSVTRTLLTLAGSSPSSSGPVSDVQIFDRRGNLVSYTDPEGHTFTVTYDGLDRPKVVTGPVAEPG